MAEETEPKRDWGRCVLCDGPLDYGHPVIVYGDGKLAHRMSTWCKAYRESVARGDKKICEDFGITLD